MAKRDYYEVLGINKNADEKAIKSAYRTLAKANHPDRNPDDQTAADRFREASEAYEILKDDQKRAAYDQMGHAAFEQSSGGRGGAGNGGFSDIFEQMFSEFSGGRGQRSQERHGDDLRFDLQISLEEAYAGCSKDIKYKTSVSCDECHGAGSASGSKPATCGSCRGAGKVRAQQGFFTVERTCPTCHGAGQIISNPCRVCVGQGRIKKSEILSVTVPAGVDTGTRIRLSGKGDAGLRGARSGDLYIFISVKSHALFARDGMHLYLRVPVPMVTATLGGTIDVPTISEKMARLQIDEGTQTGRKFRMRGKGLPALRGSTKGDQIVEIEVETPTNLTAKQTDLIKEFANAGDASPQASSFIKKIKGLWT